MTATSQQKNDCSSLYPAFHHTGCSSLYSTIHHPVIGQLALPVSDSDAPALPGFDPLTSSSLALHLPPYIQHRCLPGETYRDFSTWTPPSPALTAESKLTPVHPEPPPLPAFEWCASQDPYDYGVAPVPEYIDYLRLPGETFTDVSTTWSLPSPTLTPENYATPLQPDPPASDTPHNPYYCLYLMGETVRLQQYLLAGQTAPSQTSDSSILWNVEPLTMSVTDTSLYQPRVAVEKRDSTTGFTSIIDGTVLQASPPTGSEISTRLRVPLPSLPSQGTDKANYALISPPSTNFGPPPPSLVLSQPLSPIFAKDIFHPLGHGISSGWTLHPSPSPGYIGPPISFYDTLANENNTTRNADPAPAYPHGSNPTKSRPLHPNPVNDNGAARLFSPAPTAHISSLQAPSRSSANAQHHVTASNSSQAAPCQRNRTFEQTPQTRPSEAVGKKRKRATEEQHSTPPRETKKQRSDGFVQKPVRRWEVWTSSSPGIRFKHSI